MDTKTTQLWINHFTVYKENKPLSAPGDLRIIPKDDRSSIETDNEQMAMLRNTTRLRKKLSMQAFI